MVLLSRVLVPILGLIVWTLIYLHARWAYEKPRGAKKTATQLAMVLAAASIFWLQIKVMEHLAPRDINWDPPYFRGFIFIECGGGLVVLYSTLFRGRARQKQLRGSETAELPDQ